MRTKFRITALCLAFILMFSMVTIVNAARTESLNLNSSQTGRFVYDEEGNNWQENWYTFTIPSDGKMEISVLGDPEIYIYLEIKNEDKTKSYTSGNGKDQTVKIQHELSAGTYYVKISTSDWDRKSGSYTIKNTFTPQHLANDIEPNDSFQKARIYSIDSTTTGHIGYATNESYDDVDWYKITIPVEGVINVSLLADPNVWVSLGLYRDDGADRITYADGKDKMMNISAPLVPGEYYIKVNSSDWDSDGGGYTLSNKFKMFGKVNETEPNNSFQQANAVSQNDIYVGTLGSNSNENRDEKDWYKIYVPSGQYLRIDLASESTLNCNIGIYNIDGSQNLNYSYTRNGNTNTYSKLNSDGTYYVLVDNPNGYGRYAIRAMISSTEPKSAPVIMIPDDPSAYKEASVPTSNVAPSTTGGSIILQVDNPLMNVNGSPQAIDMGRGTTPLVYNGRTLVPIRAIIEAMGGTVGWDGNTQTVTLKVKSNTIALVIDSANANVNGANKTMDVAPTVIDGRTMIPVRFVLENFGCKIDWNEANQVITISY